MCLHTIFRNDQKKVALAKLPKVGYYWKSLSEENGAYYPIMRSLPYDKPFKYGWNRTGCKYIGIGYKIGFHLHKTRKAAASWSSGLPVRCKVEKKDIVAIGTQRGDLTIVTKRIWIPKPRKKKSA